MGKDKLFTSDVCELLGIKPSTWQAYRTRGFAPPEDGTEIEGGSARPWWRLETIAKRYPDKFKTGE